MFGLATPYLHIKNALTAHDLEFLRDSCKSHLAIEGIPCYVLIDKLKSTACMKIGRELERWIGEPMYYLNDFYIYTDDSFSTDWHMDTELFSFDRAVNAWILLSPDHVDDPIGFVDDMNDVPARYYHGVRVEGDQYVFGNYCTGKRTVRSRDVLQAGQIHTPRVELGDILAIDVKRFHKTNTYEPKHALAIKFVMKGQHGFLSTDLVDPKFWPETGTFRDLVKNARVWEDVLDGIRRTLRSDGGRQVLSEGFLPGHFDLFRRMAQSL